MTTNDIRCPQCGWQGNLHIAQTVMKATQCPNCGTKHPPLKLAEDGLIKTNWQDMRILCIYAQRFGAIFDQGIPGNRIAIEILNRIVKEMARYQPPNAPNLDPQLTDQNIAKDIEQRKIKGMPSPYLLDLVKRDDEDKPKRN